MRSFRIVVSGFLKGLVIESTMSYWTFLEASYWKTYQTIFIEFRKHIRWFWFTILWDDGHSINQHRRKLFNSVVFQHNLVNIKQLIVIDLLEIFRYLGMETNVMAALFEHLNGLKTTKNIVLPNMEEYILEIYQVLPNWMLR